MAMPPIFILLCTYASENLVIVIPRFQMPMMLQVKHTTTLGVMKSCPLHVVFVIPRVAQVRLWFVILLCSKSFMDSVMITIWSLKVLRTCGSTMLVEIIFVSLLAVVSSSS